MPHHNAPCCDAATLAQLEAELIAVDASLSALLDMYDENLAENQIISTAMGAYVLLRNEIVGGISYCQHNPCGSALMADGEHVETYKPSEKIARFKKAAEQFQRQVESLSIRMALLKSGAK